MFAPDTPARESGGYPEPGVIQDVANHPDNSLPGPMQPAMKHSTEMAGDVIPIGTDPYSRTSPSDMGKSDASSIPYALGTKSAPGIVGIGRDNLRDWAKRTGDRLK